MKTIYPSYKKYFTSADPEWKSLIADQNKIAVYNVKQKAYKFVEKKSVVTSKDKDGNTEYFY